MGASCLRWSPKKKSVNKAKLGVSLDLTTERARVKSIKRGSAASRIGLQPDDVIIQFDGEIITDSRHLIRAVQQHVPCRHMLYKN